MSELSGAAAADAANGWAVAAVLALASLAVAAVLRWRRTAGPLAGRPGWLAQRIHDRLGGYRHVVNQVDASLPRTLATPRRVAVIGGGLAGIGAAATLAERGFAVTLLEREPEIGGKIAAFTVRSGGETLPAEHGFHAFFRHYYNLDAFLERIGVRRSFRAIDDYRIYAQDGAELVFPAGREAPGLNLVSMASAGLFRWRDLLQGPALHRMDVLLAYDRESTFAALDDTSFRDFADAARLPPRLRLAFSTFARAFFAEDDRLSMAELVKSFHFYYLSHDHGLGYDYPADDYEDGLIGPIRRHLEAHGVELLLGRGVERLGRDAGGLTVDGERFDHVVLAANAAASRRLLLEGDLDLDDRFREGVAALRCGQRYAVLRIWIDRDVRESMPVFVATERRALLDAVAVYHRITPSAAAWAREHGGAVLELHSYAVPDELATDETVRAALLDELCTFFPEVAGHRIVHEHLQVKADFTALHTGMARGRPGCSTPVPGLYLAGDWVALPFPAMLMEGAFSAGLTSANLVLAAEGLQQEQVYSVPLRGLLAGRRRAGEAA